MTIHFDNSYTRLPERFFARVGPNQVAKPTLLRLNEALCGELGLDSAWLRTSEGIEFLAGNIFPEGADPVAMAYAGHQFGHFVPQLGDGRATLVGEIVKPDGGRRDLQLKGSGPTPFSRRGDGRAALGPVLREYIVSEAMHALGIPTTRSLAVVSSGEEIYREIPLPGAVLTRIASSHVRVGTFQFFAARRDVEGLRLLADHVIERLYPEIASSQDRYRALLAAVIERQAGLVAHWMLVGFVHGVLNTDNVSIAGETIDYGPCAFLDGYDPKAVFSSIDGGGRYAYENQPGATLWNLTRLAEALLPLLSDQQHVAITIANQALAAFLPLYLAAYRQGLRRKIGIFNEAEGDDALAQELLDLMAAGQADLTVTFRRLSEGRQAIASQQVHRVLPDSDRWGGWIGRWRQRLDEQGRSEADRVAVMKATNPAVIPRNHLVEAAIAAAVQESDYRPFEGLIGALARPFADQEADSIYALPPAPEERVLQTFCGT